LAVAAVNNNKLNWVDKYVTKKKKGEDAVNDYVDVVFVVVDTFAVTLDLNTVGDLQ
jgi:hypothetical protein